MYMYSKLKEALFGKTGKDKNNPNWSPNNVRAIVITRNFILVAHHITPPTVVRLFDEVFADLQKNGATGSLHNLLSQKQLSCLEEIIVDGIFQNYKGVMDLEGYINSLVSTVSRLRYYGYASDIDVDEVYEKYNRVSINAVEDYCYVTDKTRTSTIQYTSTENETWYLKYNLRPDRYLMDIKKGTLHTRFKKVEKDIENKKKEELSRLTAQGINSALVALYRQDIQYADGIANFLKLKSLIPQRESHDSICRQVGTAIRNRYGSGSMSVNTEELHGALNEAKVSMSKKEFFMLKVYKSCGILSSKPVELNLEELVMKVKEFDGLLNFPDLLLTICTDLVTDNTTDMSDVKLMMCMLLSSEEMDSCKGDIKSLLQSKRASLGCVDWYTNLLLGVCGYNKESFAKATRR